MDEKNSVLIVLLPFFQEEKNNFRKERSKERNSKEREPSKDRERPRS
ncbi:hypothetical protein AALP_AAs60109U000100 [Arabis alpina]|uniref:Uncharacterized protein n=1 Tax=Arabis alpina TaxID=50452 RepID=A0A087G194_ARAAL|nr:hypothetical protein AALP_AAs60109U000100 [Arabis alpina]